MEEELKAQGGFLFMLNFVVEKGASKDHDRSRFVQQSALDFSLYKFPYTIDMCFLFIIFFVQCNRHVYTIRHVFSTALHSSHFFIILSPFHLF